MNTIEEIIKDSLGKVADDDVLTVVILHKTIVELVSHIMKYEGDNLPPPIINDLLTICLNRVKEFYRQRDIQTISDAKTMLQ